MGQVEYERIGRDFASMYGTTMGQMFGKACLKSEGKAFAAFFKGDMVFKLGEEKVNSLLHHYDGSVKWDPSHKNRPMKAWIQVPEVYKKEWPDLAKVALNFTKQS